MGLPNINIIFRTAASTVVSRSQRGVVAVILKDSADGAAGEHVITEEKEIPAVLSAVNRDYLAKTLIGYVNKPKKAVAYVLAADASDLSAALDFFSRQKINYLVGPPDCTADEAAQIVAWIKAQRADKRTPKAVLPNTAADSEGILNFTTGNIAAGDAEYAAAGYCGRMAGLAAGTPITISCTYAVLPEVTSVKRLTEAEMDAAVDGGELILFHDGEKVKVGRGVNSLRTTTEEKGEAFKKIKIVDAVDMMQDDIRMLTQDSYIGKYANSYDNKCLLITAIREYFAELEAEGVLAAGKSEVEIDMEKQKQYLADAQIDVSSLSEQEIKTADTGSHVFLKGTVGIMDTIEDIDLDMEF